MARQRLLSDLAVRKAEPRPKPYRLFDGEGLALRVAPSGAKSWQFRYWLDGKPQTATLGKLDAISLAEAREQADKLRKRAARGEHLTRTKHSEKARRKAEGVNTFEVVAKAWVAREARRWTADYTTEVRNSLRRHLATINRVPVASLTAPTMAPLLRKVEASAPMMLEKVRRRLNAILDYAVEQGDIERNPLPAVRRGRKVARRHYPAVTDLGGLGEILRIARAADPCKGIARAHVLLAFSALRVSEVVGATWDEFALDGAAIPIDPRRTRHDPQAGNWSVPRERMKRKDEARGPHVVPLPPALLAELRAWHAADAGSSAFVCAAPRDPAKHVTPEGCEKFYRDVLKLQGKHSPHSWRAAFSTVCREAGKDGDTIEAQLDHVVGNKIASAYDRAQRLELRRELLAWYEATLIAARDGAEVVPLKRQG